MPSPQKLKGPVANSGEWYLHLSVAKQWSLNTKSAWSRALVNWAALSGHLSIAAGTEGCYLLYLMPKGPPGNGLSTRVSFEGRIVPVSRTMFLN